MNLETQQKQLVALLTTQLSTQLINPTILNYKPSGDGKITGKAKSSDRVFNFVIRGYKVSVKPSANMDSTLFSHLYLRLDGTRSNPSCTKNTYACKGERGIGCIALTKICERDERSTIGRERLDKIKALSGDIANKIAKLSAKSEARYKQDPSDEQADVVDKFKQLKKQQRELLPLATEISKQRSSKANQLNLERKLFNHQSKIKQSQQKISAKKAFDSYVAKGEQFLKANKIDDLFDSSPNKLSKNIKVDSNVLQHQSRDLIDKTTSTFFNLSQGKGASSFQKLQRTTPRAYATPSDGAINTGHKQTATEFKNMMFHEMAHHVEFEDPAIKLAAQHFVSSRASGSQKLLSEITGNVMYESERAYPDKFINPYVGKIYENGSTEVLSMGIEQFTDKKKLARFIEKDREHFLFVLGVLKN
jgi:hypothetical protein